MVGILPVNWATLLGSSSEVSALLSDFQQAVGSIGVGEARPFVLGLHGMGREAVVQAVEAMVLRTVRDVGGMEVSRDDALQEAGMDSLASMEVQRAIQQQLGLARSKLRSTFRMIHHLPDPPFA